MDEATVIARLRARLRGGLAVGEARRESVLRLRGALDEGRTELEAAFADEPTGWGYCWQHATLFDGLLAMIYEVAADAVAERLGPMPADAGVCLAAVGGYGRRGLAPWSDIDVVFLPSHDGHEYVDTLVRDCLSLLNEVLLPGKHPRVAHSYRPISDLDLINHQTATALLESRPVAGDARLQSIFLDRLMQSIQPVDFLHVNVTERERVWHDPARSLFAVEPDLKDGPGGLRDFQAAIWVSKVIYDIEAWDVLSVLCGRGILSEAERKRLMEAMEFQLCCRNWLHFAKGQKLDVIHTDYQSAMGHAFGYQRDASGVPTEQLMAQYYASARTVAAFYRQMFHLAREGRMPFRHGLEVDHWTLREGPGASFSEDPRRLIYIFEERQRFDFQLALDLERQIAANAQRIDDEVRAERSVGASLRNMLSFEGDVAGTLRAMLDSGVLEQLIPEFAPLMSLLPTDPAHEYTVGEHSLRVVEELQRLRDDPDGEVELVLSAAIHQLPQPEVLFLAGLLHDVGKLDGTGEHSLTGAPVAQRVAERLGFQGPALERLGFLVREHLTMMRTARLYALELDDTINGFVACLPEDDTLDALDMLTLLTLADTRMVGANVLRDTDRRLAMQLFARAAKRVQERELGPSSEVPATRRFVQNAALRDIAADRIEAHLESLPTWYAVNTDAETVARHISYLDRLTGGEVPVVEFKHSREASHTELIVCTPDRLGLLRDIAAVLTANSLDIYLVQLAASQRPDQPTQMIATIWADDFGQPVGHYKRDALRRDLRAVLGDGRPAPELLEARNKLSHEGVLLHDLSVQNDVSRYHTLVHVRAGDQQGLLYRLCEALTAEGLDIRVAKVTTWSGAAEDAFYVVRYDSGEKIADEQVARLRDRLRARLRGEDPEQVGPALEPVLVSRAERADG